MKTLAMALATGAMLLLANPALAHEWGGRGHTHAYPSHGYRYQRPYYPALYRSYGTGAYRSSYWGYRRPVVVVRQGPPYGRAWGHRRAYPARYGTYPRYGYYPGYEGSRTCDHNQSGGWGQHQDHDHDRRD